MDKKNWEDATKAVFVEDDTDLIELSKAMDFKTDWTALPTEETYYPTRLEFMFAHALQGLIIGRSEKDIRKAVTEALKLSQEALRALDDTTKD